MRLGVREVAAHMGVPESTVFRWVERSGLPATQVDGQFRFHPEAVYEWATERGLPVAGDLFGSAAASSATAAPLARAMRAGGIVSGLSAADRCSVMAAATERLSLPAHADRGVILAMLLARAKLGTVGVAEGFAIPHVRDPIVLRVAEPQVTLFLLDHPIDFDGRGRRPVHSLFLVVAPTIRGHLLVLSRIGTVLQDAAVRAAIEDRRSPDLIIAAIEAAEARLNGRAGAE